MTNTCFSKCGRCFALCTFAFCHLHGVVWSVLLSRFALRQKWHYGRGICERKCKSHSVTKYIFTNVHISIYLNMGFCFCYMLCFVGYPHYPRFVFSLKGLTSSGGHSLCVLALNIVYNSHTMLRGSESLDHMAGPDRLLLLLTTTTMVDAALVCVSHMCATIIELEAANRVGDTHIYLYKQICTKPRTNFCENILQFRFG